MKSTEWGACDARWGPLLGCYGCNAALSQTLVEPDGGSVEKVIAHRMATIEHVAKVVFAKVDTRQWELDTGDDVQAPLWSICHRSETIDCTDIERKVRTAHTGEFGCQNQKVRAVDQRRHSPGEEQRETQILRRRIGWVGERVNLVLEGEHHPWIDLER